MNRLDKSDSIRMLLSFFLGFFYFHSFAQFKLTDPLPKDPNVKIGKLPNGLTYYIQKNVKPEKKVELRLVVNAGSILEDPDQQGLAHFMEHMNFNGSKHFPHNDLVDYLQKVGVKFGADLNAYTSFDETVYMLPIPSDDPEVVEKGFTVLEDWAGNNLLDKTEIEKERGVVLEESRLSKGAQERLLRQYFPRLFNGSRYAQRLPIGKDSILKTFQPAILERFYKQWYRPDLMAVVVVGDMDPAEAEKKIKAHFSGLKNPAIKKPRPVITPIPARSKADAMVLTDEEMPNTIVFVFNFIKPAKKINTWADYRQSVLQDLVNNLINQRLEELTQKDNPPFVTAFSGREQIVRGYEGFFSYALLGSSTPGQAIDALIQETERARKFGFLQSELDRAKADLLNQSEQAFNEKDKMESSRLVGGYVNHFLQNSPIPGVENRYKFMKQILPTISLQEMNQVAKALSPSTTPFVMVQAPKNKSGELPSDADLLQEVVAATKKTVLPYTEKKVASNIMDHDGLSGKIISETKNEKLNTINFTLSNGVTITVKPTNFKNDEIVMDAWRHGGWQRFPLEEKENAESAAQFIQLMGVKDMTPTDLKKFLSGKTVRVTPYMNPSEEGIEGSSSVKDFETFLQLVNLYITQPRKDENLLKAYLGNVKGFLKFAKEDPQTYFQDTMQKIIYNNSPWLSTLPTEEQINKINADKVMEIYKNVFGNANGLHFTFVGNVDVENARSLFEKYLGSLPSQPTTVTYKDIGMRPVTGGFTVNIKKGKEPQSEINILWNGETAYDRDERMKLNALIEVLNIKIIEKLREELSGMYSGGIRGDIIKRPYVHYEVNAVIPCGPENVNKLTAAFFELVKNAQEGKIEQTDLDKVKETWKKKYQEQLKENDFWLTNLSQAFIDEYNPESVLDYESRVNALTIADLQKAAKKFLDPDKPIRIVLYPENANVEEGMIKKPF
jgi:zinc protease